MKPFVPPDIRLARASYAVSRRGGRPPELARAELGLPAEVAAGLERLFRSLGGGGPDPMRPRFARHRAHVRAVLAQGGYPAIAPGGRR